MTSEVGSTSVHGAPTKVYRAMRKDHDGKPRCGSTGNLLGVRPGIDITPDQNGLVVAGIGGLSVTPDDPARLPLHVRPPRLGGKGNLPVFEISREHLGDVVAYRADPERPSKHGFVEPTRPMPLDRYQTALAATRQSWEELA